MGKRFSLQFNDRGIGKVTDKVLLENIDTGVVEYLTADKLLDILGLKGQVKFPAVQVPSANVNTLDDYEEGTWTPILTFGGASVGITYTIQEGKYTKIGNLLFLSARITLTSKGSSVGAAVITDMPFTALAYSPIVLYLNHITFADFPEAYTFGTTIILQEVTNAGTVTNLADTDFANNSLIRLTCMFRA